MAEKKDNNILIRLSDDELRVLNEGWFKAVSLAGRPVTKSEYIRACISYTAKFLTDVEDGRALNLLDPNKYDYLKEEA